MSDRRNSMHWNSPITDPNFSGAGEDFEFGADDNNNNNNSFGCSYTSPFDWSDEQLRDLIDGEGAISGDHVVPYPYQSERNIEASEGDLIINQFDATKVSNIKAADRKKTVVDPHNAKNTAENEALLPASSSFVVDSWPLEHNTTAQMLDGTGQLDNDPEFIQKLDANIANMVILDDLDNILSNDSPDFGQTSLPSIQNQGLSSEDVTSIPETKSEHMLVQNPHWTRGWTTNVSETFPETSAKKELMQIHYNLGSEPYRYPMPVLSQFHDEQGNRYHQSVPCSSFAFPQLHSNSLNPQLERTMDGLGMSPEEKIEKLRRQQQMRATLAIQKLQQQIRNQAVSTEHPVLARQNLFIDAKSHFGQDHSNVARNDLHPELILRQLQETILKLDIRTKLNIRDSFHRLAQNARQRQYANNTGCLNTDMNSRLENETNPMDRAVAHLLFHQSSEVPINLTEIPEPRLSEKFYYGSNSTGSLSFAR